MSGNIVTLKDIVVEFDGERILDKINIDITFQKDSSNIDAKRITLEPEELEQGLLGDLLEQFISEYKKEALADDHT